MSGPGCARSGWMILGPELTAPSRLGHDNLLQATPRRPRAIWLSTSTNPENPIAA